MTLVTLVPHGTKKVLPGTVVWSSLGHPLGSTQKVPCRRRCLTGGPFIHCKLAKWEQPKGALQAKVPYRGGALQGHDHCIMWVPDASGTRDSWVPDAPGNYNSWFPDASRNHGSRVPDASETHVILGIIARFH